MRLAAKQFPRSREARLRLAMALAENGEFAEAETILDLLSREDAWEWRVLWFRGRMLLAQAKPAEARKLFDQVYFDLPGEIAPKLALGLAAEMTNDVTVAMKMYELVSRTDPGFVSAVFGLARCHAQQGDRRSAVAALDRIPQSSALYLRARVEAARMLVRKSGVGSEPSLEDLASASAVAEGLTLGDRARFTLSSQIYTAAVEQIGSKAARGKGTPGLKILGQPLEERPLRAGLESSLRSMARFLAGEERIKLVDQANTVRPRTFV
jgi:serine/threonine-protein kinase PknG